MAMPHKTVVAVIVSLVALVSLGFNVYVLATQFMDKLRIEGYNTAMSLVIETANRDGKIDLNYADKEGKQAVLNLVTSK